MPSVQHLLGHVVACPLTAGRLACDIHAQPLFMPARCCLHLQGKKSLTYQEPHAAAAPPINRCAGTQAKGELTTLDLMVL